MFSGIELKIVCNTAAETHNIFAASMRGARRKSRCLIKAFKEANPNPTGFEYEYKRPYERAAEAKAAKGLHLK